jgi:5-methylcytosine-specific restriction endonuclease McrA
MASRLYTKEILEKNVRDSRSFRDLVIRLGCNPHGGTISRIQGLVELNNIDHSHFSGKSWSKSSVSKTRRSAVDILVSGKKEPAFRLRRALSEIGVEYACSVCGISKWNGNDITLEVDHVDGNNKNNSIENIRYLCPNCHSQTDNYRFKGRSHSKEHQEKVGVKCPSR